LVPPFNMETVARESDARLALATPLPLPTPLPPFRKELDTLTDETELEAARVKSIYPLDEPAPPPSIDGDPDLEVTEDGISPLDEARVLAASGDEFASMAILEDMLKEEPTNFAARQILEGCERTLVAKFSARLGSLSRVPRLAIPEDRLSSLALDHRAGFLLALVDGASEVEAIVDISGLPAPDALRALVELYERGVIAFAD